MNNTFDISRFGKYLKYDLVNCWKENRTFLLTLALVPVIIYITTVFYGMLTNGLTVFFNMAARPALAARIASFATVAGIFVVFFPARSYGFITEKARGSAWVELPVSKLEKFLSMMLICLIIMPLAFFCTYLLSDAVICLADSKCGIPIFSSWLGWGEMARAESEVTLGGNGLWVIVATVLSFMSIFLLGALIFKKKKVLGTILALFILSIVLSLILSLFIKSVGPHAISDFFTKWAYNHADNLEFWFNFWGNVGTAIVVIGCGVWSWFRIKKVQH